MKKVTKKMQEVLYLMKLGHVIFEAWSAKKDAGTLHYKYQDDSVVYTIEECITSHTSTAQIHSSVMTGLIERRLIKRVKHIHHSKRFNKDLTFHYYTLNK